jgi:molybdopterin synthase catalytic subunit
MIDIRIKAEPLSITEIEKLCADPGVGGLVIFSGTVRNQTQGRPVKYLEFETYEKMALLEMEKIGHAVVRQTGAGMVAIHHRIGRLDIGEIAVIIGVACPHRKAAFEGCSFAIDTLKESVPIWKKEYFEDGAVWVAAHP